MKDKKTLSDKRKELFDIMIKKMPTAGRIYRIIKEQDRGFINDLKEGTNRVIKTYTYSEMYREMHKLIDKLAGEELTK